MNHTTFFVIAVAVTFGCGRAEPVGSDVTGMNSAAPPAEDNTKKNERDRNHLALTPGDQGMSEADRSITQRVRQDIVGHDDLSMTAENVKIITVDGVVTLRGPVHSEQEQTTIAAIARRVDGVKRVDDQIEVVNQ